MKLMIAAFFLTLFSMNIASAKTFKVMLDSANENANGHFISSMYNAQTSTITTYELIPSTAELKSSLRAKNCASGINVDASVLSRTIETDHENRREAGETVRLLVLEILDCAGL